MATKLHALLAVKDSLSNQAKATREELINTLKSKRHLFSMKVKKFTAKTETGTAQERVEEQREINTTVPQELLWLAGKIAPALDIEYQIDIANRDAKADVIIDGVDTPLLKDVPSATLLQLEKRAQELLDLCKAIPTLDNATSFSPDSDLGAGIYRAKDVTKDRTEKKQMPLVLYPATDKHPAQVQLITEDTVIGTITESEWSALIKLSDKANLLDRCEKLVRAFKAARSKANEQEVEVSGKQIGDKILNYLFEPITTGSISPTAATRTAVING